MNDVKRASGLPATVAFRLGTLGSLVSDEFAARIEQYGLKPKHAGVLTALSVGACVSQQDLATRLGVAPSLVVSLADHLESLGAVQRVRDPGDRRRQVLNLTDRGKELLADCAAAARSYDDELTSALTQAQSAALRAALGILTAQAGLP
jgi:DNA-binding MarR family transcriptional regulator